MAETRVAVITIMTTKITTTRKMRGFKIRLNITHKYVREQYPLRFNISSSSACRCFASLLARMMLQTRWVLTIRLKTMLFTAKHLSTIQRRRSIAITGIRPKLIYRTTIIAPASKLRRPSTKLVAGFTHPALVEVAVTPVTDLEGHGKQREDPLLSK